MSNEIVPVTASLAVVSPVTVPVHCPSAAGHVGFELPASFAPPLDEPLLEEPPLEEPLLDEPLLEEPPLEEPLPDEPLDEPLLEEPPLEEPLEDEPDPLEPPDDELSAGGGSLAPPEDDPAGDEVGVTSGVPPHALTSKAASTRTRRRLVTGALLRLSPL
jgi:hypothetical protein